MPVFISTFLGALLTILGSAVGRIMIALGMGLTIFTGMGTTLSNVKQSGIGAFASLPPEIAQLFGLLRLGEAFSMLASTVAIKLISDGLNGDAVKKIAMK